METDAWSVRLQLPPRSRPPRPRGRVFQSVSAKISDFLRDLQQAVSSSLAVIPKTRRRSQKRQFADEIKLSRIVANDLTLFPGQLESGFFLDAVRNDIWHSCVNSALC